MFEGCISLTSIDLSSFNTTNVSNMYRMFFHCTSLKSLDLSNFNTSNVTNMQQMFSSCTSLTSLDLSNFNTSKVTKASELFSLCSSLKTIYAGNWNIKGTEGSSYEGYSPLFYKCDNLVGGKGTKIGSNLYDYDSNGQPLYYYCENNADAAHIDDGKDNPGLFTAK